MREVHFDESQKKAITIETNAVISAGAGSGKTSVLSSRFEYLVTHKKQSVPEILTLTFTKKATIEMYGRIYKKLSECAPESVAEFNKANIKTLDSYCASIAKVGSHFYGISPQFVVDAEAVKERVSKLALPFILQHQDNNAIRALVSTHNYDEVANELFVVPILSYATISSPLDFFAAKKRQEEYIITEWERQSKQALNAIHSLQALLSDFDGNKNTVFIKALEEAFKKECPECPLIAESDFENGTVDSLVKFILFIDDIAFLSPRGKNLDALKEVLYSLREYSMRLSSLAQYVYGSPITNAVIPLLYEFQETVNRIKRSAAMLTYTDSASLATSILRDHLDIRAAEKRKYKSIMIDEFQDNNALQRDMLFMLAEKAAVSTKNIPRVADLCTDKLFFVGDEKQSIYRFRGADVSVFRALSNDFKNGNLSLKTNYRSHPALVAGFNTIFGGAEYPPGIHTEARAQAPSLFFSSPSEAVPAYEAVYSNADVSQEKKEEIETLFKNQHAYKAYFAPRIHIALYDTNQEAGEDEAADEEAEALWVSKKIKELLEENVLASEIAILFRTYTLQPLYERTLLAQGIPYNTETITGFFNSAPVTDTFAFLRICAYPEDSVAYETVLRSPFVHLSRDEADAILAYNTAPFESPAEEILSKESAARYEKAKKLFFAVKEKARREGLANTITYLWYNAGYRYETLWNERVRMYASLYDRIFELARLADENTLSLAEFVDSVRTYEDESKHLDNMDIPLEQSAGVHLLTIFKSKGLQYKVVFVCGAHKGSGSDKNDTPVYMSKDFGITINTPACPALKKGAKNYFYEKVREEEKRMASAELRRLTYVALTRAEERVFVTGKSTLDFSKAEKFLPGALEGSPRTILETLLPCIAFYKDAPEGESPLTLETIFPQKKVLPAEKISKEDVIKKIDGLFEKASIAAPEFVFAPHISPSAFKKPDDESPERMFEQRKSTAPFAEINEIVQSSILKNVKGSAAKPAFSYSQFGTIAHAYFEAALSEKPPVVPERCFAALGDDEEKRERVKTICVDLAAAFLKTDLGQRAKQSSFLRTEFSFRSRVGEDIVNGQIDLIFKDAAGRYTIVDYKTNQAVTPELYYTQLAFYRHAISKLFFCPKEDISCWLYYMRFAKAVDISCECARVDLAAEIARAKKEIATQKEQRLKEEDFFFEV